MKQGYALGLMLLLAMNLLACTGPATAGSWEEPFDAVGSWDLSSDVAAEVTIDEGQLRIFIQQPGQLAWASAGKEYRDCQLTVEAIQMEGPADNEYGVLVRMDENKRFYAFSISGDGYVRAALYDDGVWTLLGPDWTPHVAIAQGAATNTLELSVAGEEFVFTINGEEALRVVNETLSQGDIGLYAGAFDTPGVHIAFDNLQVTTLP